MIWAGIKQYTNDLLDLLYPDACVGCGEPLVGNEATICTQCRVLLPRTNSHLLAIDTLGYKFEGKVPVNGAFSFLKFERGGRVQRFLYALKYQNRSEVGVVLGQLYGQDLKLAGWEKRFDLLIPIPLHAQKLAQRGYNQSDKLAEGLAEALGVHLRNDVLVRTTFTDTQTKKDRWQRYENVRQIFEINDKAVIKNKRVVLIDDVITTGATLESGIKTLWAAQAKEVWVLTIAMAV